MRKAREILVLVSLLLAMGRNQICVIDVISSGEQGDYYSVTVNGDPGTMECDPGTPVAADYCGPVPTGCRIVQ